MEPNLCSKRCAMYVSEAPFFTDQCLMELIKKDTTVCGQCWI